MLLLSSFVVVVGLIWAALALQPGSRQIKPETTVRVYCAASAFVPVTAGATWFNATHGVNVTVVRTGGSGELAGQIAAEIESGMLGGADLFITADEVLLNEPWIARKFVLAKQRPVIAIRTGSHLQIDGLSALVNRTDFKFGVASQRAAIGQTARQIASTEGVVQQLEKMKAVDTENVMTLAQALATGSLDAAIVWDSTVHQVNDVAGEEVLSIAAILGDDESVGPLVAGILVSSDGAEIAAEFCRFMITAPECREAFVRNGFQLVD